MSNPNDHEPSEFDIMLHTYGPYAMYLFAFVGVWVSLGTSFGLWAWLLGWMPGAFVAQGAMVAWKPLLVLLILACVVLLIYAFEQSLL